MSKKATPLDYLHAMDRYRFLTILKAASECQEHQFIKQASMLWLVNYPGDLYVQYIQAQNFIDLGLTQKAIDSFQELTEKDPYFIEPIQGLTNCITDGDLRSHYSNLRQYLTQDNQPEALQEAWLQSLWKARAAFSDGEYDRAITLIHEALLETPASPLPAILHLKTAYRMAQQEMLSNLSGIYIQQWPKCLQINIIKSLSEMELGLEADAVQRLHWVAANDSAGQVIQHLMGQDHRFRDLWPEKMEIFFDLPIPASVSSNLGWNQLQSGNEPPPVFKQHASTKSIMYEQDKEHTQEIRLKSQEASQPAINQIEKTKIHEDESTQVNLAAEKDLEEIHNSFSKLADKLKNPDIERSDNRFPVYVILTSKKQLETIYGPNTASIVDDFLKNLVGLIQNLPNWGAVLHYPDDPSLTSDLGIKPIMANDAWQIKLAITDLDAALAKKGEMIGALLIIGGPEVVPYHHLPNPTNDNDLDVPSDNPYATIDQNYFIPQWPVGRLPGESGSDPGLLLHQIRQLLHEYQQKSKKSNRSFGNYLSSLFSWITQTIIKFGANFRTKPNFGYSAEIWREASINVYRKVGKGKDLQLSPPTNVKSLQLAPETRNGLGYFNLHGVKDGPNWYGQKDFSSKSIGPDYPIALSPAMYNEQISSPKILLTEACYGANIFEKRQDEALSLKCLDTGTSSFIGSTCIAYGSLAPPLVAADYLAEKFWDQLLQGQPAGYSLMQAKLKLTEEMIRQQGFLDGEDQKTILSFVLFGDPLATHDDGKALPKPILRFKTHPSVRTISDSDLLSSTDQTRMPKSVNRQVKKTVEKYLPGLENAQIQFNQSEMANNQKSNVTKDSQRYLVTMHKSIEQNHHTIHHHFARMTFDKQGKLMKFTISR